jgi:hypothetical protein
LGSNDLKTKSGEKVESGMNTVTNPASILRIEGLAREEQDALRRLLAAWDIKRNRNMLRLNYYDGKVSLKDLNISIPPRLRSIETVCGWPAKAVDTLAARSRFDGYTFAGEIESDLAAILRENDFKNLYSQTTKSALINSCSFVTVSAGSKEEPPVVLNTYSALNACALWSMRKKRIDYGMVIVEANEKGSIEQLNLYTDQAIIEIMKGAQGRWVFNRIPHNHGRPLMEPFVYRPSLDRPFGRSRISRAVMSLTDSAVREALRAEVAAEFFTAPQLYLLGASEEDFDRDRWTSYTGSLFVAGRDDEGETPSYGQLPQGTMQPHIEYMRALAAKFAGETNIPVAYLGIIHDNPASAEAMYAASEELIIEAQDLNATLERPLRTIGLLALAITQKKSLSALGDTERTLMPKFMNPGRPSIVSQSDAMVKQASVASWLAETDVFLEELGYTEEQIARLLSEKRKASAMETITRLVNDADNQSRA